MHETMTPMTHSAIDDAKCQRLERLYAMIGRDPSVRSDALLRQLIAAHGLDPDMLVKPPK